MYKTQFLNSVNVPYYYEDITEPLCFHFHNDFQNVEGYRLLDKVEGERKTVDAV